MKRWLAIYGAFIGGVLVTGFTAWVIWWQQTHTTDETE